MTPGAGGGAPREPFRHPSALAAACVGVIAGYGTDSYVLAIDALSRRP
ncbi:MAG: type II 3-dehydroquinate dehydratase [Caldimonas sp.]